MDAVCAGGRVPFRGAAEGVRHHGHALEIGSGWPGGLDRHDLAGVDRALGEIARGHVKGVYRGHGVKRGETRQIGLIGENPTAIAAYSWGAGRVVDDVLAISGVVLEALEEEPGAVEDEMGQIAGRASRQASAGD